MQVFYSNNISDQSIVIDGQEHIHLSKVLRKKPGDEVHVSNGEGLMILAKVISTTKKFSLLEQVEVIKNQKENLNNLVLAVAPTKSMDRYEWMIEKSIEIGVKRILPFYSHHSERRRLKVERLKLIAIAAMKQSKTLFLPEISNPISFKDLCETEFNQKYIAFMDEEKLQLKDVIVDINRQKDLLFAIGPEGGFSEKEVKEAKENGFSPISLGANRLRTETAAIFCASAYQLL